MTEDDTKELARLERILAASQGVGFKDRREHLQALIDARRASETPVDQQSTPDTLGNRSSGRSKIIDEQSRLAELGMALAKAQPLDLSST